MRASLERVREAARERRGADGMLRVSVMLPERVPQGEAISSGPSVIIATASPSRTTSDP